MDHEAISVFRALWSAYVSVPIDTLTDDAIALRNRLLQCAPSPDLATARADLARVTGERDEARQREQEYMAAFPKMRDARGAAEDAQEQAEAERDAARTEATELRDRNDGLTVAARLHRLAAEERAVEVAELRDVLGALVAALPRCKEYAAGGPCGRHATHVAEDAAGEDVGMCEEHAALAVGATTIRWHAALTRALALLANAPAGPTRGELASDEAPRYLLHCVVGWSHYGAEQWKETVSGASGLDLDRLAERHGLNRGMVGRQGTVTPGPSVIHVERLETALREAVGRCDDDRYDPLTSTRHKCDACRAALGLLKGTP